MHVLVTGASGHIASAVIPELLSAGHTVTGLARSDRSAAVIRSLGADVRRGDLDDFGNGIWPRLNHAVLPDKEFRVGIDGEPVKQGLQFWP